MIAALKHRNLWGSNGFFMLLSFVLLLCLFSAFYLENYYIALLPFAIVIGLLSLADISKLYNLLILVIPITIEFYLPNGLGIDLPGEIILIVLTGLSPFLFLLKFKRSGLAYLNHPISIGILFHLGWILIAGVLGENPTIGIKFFLAKCWYVIPFFFISLFIFRSKQSFRNFFWVLLIPLSITIVYVLVKHAMLGFSFSEVNSAVSPIYRNHVNYGLLMVSFLPFIWAFYFWYEKGSLERLFLIAVFSMFLLAIYFTYTRAAQLAVIIGVACYFIIRYRLLIYAILSSGIVVVLLGFFFVNGSKYLQFAPQYEKTITHENYDNLIEATVKLEDISTMERVNRWIAGGHMIGERPWTGFGPGNFYFNYKNYMVSSFVTYVSDNPDKSGIHNYYLMTLVEQGIFGLIFFLALLIAAILSGSSLYHRLADPELKVLVMAATISIILIAITVLINDLIEALKIGGMFFISMAIIVRVHVLSRLEKP